MRPALLCALLALPACAADLRQEPTDDGQDQASLAVTTDGGDGTLSTQIDASTKTGWVYFDLDAAALTPESSDPATAPDWDLAFQRYRVKMNGGASGAGGVEVAVLPGADFDGLAQAPAAGYATDSAGTEDSRLVFLRGDGWYAYDLSAHKLSARDIVFVVHTTAGAYFKLKLLDYYDAAGTDAHPRFRWAPLAAP